MNGFYGSKIDDYLNLCKARLLWELNEKVKDLIENVSILYKELKQNYRTFDKKR